MEYQQIISDIRKKKFAPIYFLMGEEPYFIDAISDTIEEEALDEAEKAFNQIVVYGRDVNVETIASHARTFPMTGDHIIVIVKEAQDVNNIEAFEKYLEVIPDTTILVFDYKYKKLDKRKSFTKEISKRGILFESKKLYDNNIPSWIQNNLKGMGYSVSQKAVQMLAAHLGTDLHKINNELVKLTIAVPKSKMIDENDVERNVGISKDYNIFELQNAIGTRDVMKANQIVNYFGDNPKENPLLPTVTILYGYFAKLLKGHYCPVKSGTALAKALDVNPFFVRDYQVAMNNYSIADCVHCVAVLREFNLKSLGYNNANVSEKDLYREMIFKIMHNC